MKIVALDAFAADQGENLFEGLHALGQVQSYPRSSPTEVVVRATGAQAILINKVAISADVVAQLPHLRYVGVKATGVNVVDLEACRARGIAVTNVPGYSTESVAQLAFALILQFTHNVTAHDAAVKAGGWAASPDFVFLLQPLTELSGKTMLTVGTGEIGSAVARIAQAFGMRTLAAQVPGRPPAAGRIPLQEALPLADVVTLHCPLTPQTKGMVNREFLGQMKPNAILINTARGPLLDESAVLEALQHSGLRVGLDVLSTEPPPAGHPLLQAGTAWSKRVVIAPHLGWATVEARQRLAKEVIENLRAFINGQPRNRVA